MTSKNHPSPAADSKEPGRDSLASEDARPEGSPQVSGGGAAVQLPPQQLPPQQLPPRQLPPQQLPPQQVRVSRSTAARRVGRQFGDKDILFVIALLAAVVLAYQPAWYGGVVWDDGAHITRPELRSWHGLYRIWFDVGTTLQYYPLLHSAFWIEYKLWGDDTLGYHLVNILLHAAVALTAAIILRRLKIPGAYLAAAIFALHPVHVESVAWITEQKNTLSALFYLASMLVYLHFDQSRKIWPYCGALLLFALGMLSKTVIATLPGALLVIFWWQRGRLSWKRDVLPLLPFLLVGAGGGMITAWWELQINKCVGPEFALTLVERCLIAGRAVWFLLWKLFWPTQLTFIYPRWEINAGTWWQYLFPLGAAALLAALWSMRRWTRAPLAALLFFGGTLFPVLGFFNLYTFRFSFVANHYQYLASLGIIALAAAGAATALTRRRLWDRPDGYALCLTLLAGLASLTWQQSEKYADVETLYRTVIAENPDCWMAYNNLGTVLREHGQVKEAVELFHRALEIKPDYAAAYDNIGLALAQEGKLDEAIVQYRKSLEIDPEHAAAHNNLGLALLQQGHAAEAIDHYRRALELCPYLATACHNLALALSSQGRVAEAVDYYRKAVEFNPGFARAHFDLARALVKLGRTDEAIVECRRTLELNPNVPEVYGNLAQLLADRGKVDEAIALLRKAATIKPDDPDARYNLGFLLSHHGRVREAMAQWKILLRLQPDNASAMNELAWVLATNPEASMRDGVQAVELARQAVKLSAGQEPNFLDTLAAAQAEAGQFTEAVETGERALTAASSKNDTALAEGIRARIKLYQDNRPYRDAPQSAPAPPNHP